jgi:hypothetical protein
MQNLTFKYFSLEPISSLVSRELLDKIQYLQNSRIDDLPIFATTDELIFEEKIIDILNCQNLHELSLILRKNKLNKLLKNSKPSLNYEFLDFWYNNYEKLSLLIEFSNKKGFN